MKDNLFLAGGLGACAYRQEVSDEILLRCWQHEEFQTECPKCKGMAYIKNFAGHTTGGGYWGVTLHCPTCQQQIHLDRYGSGQIKVHWKELRRIAQEACLASENE